MSTARDGFAQVGECFIPTSTAIGCAEGVFEVHTACSSLSMTKRAEAVFAVHTACSSLSMTKRAEAVMRCIPLIFIEKDRAWARVRCRFEHLVGELMIASAAKSGGDLNPAQMRKLQVPPSAVPLWC